MSMEEIKNSIIDLYFGVKVRKLEEINNITDDIIKQEKQVLDKLPIIEIIN